MIFCDSSRETDAEGAKDHPFNTQHQFCEMVIETDRDDAKLMLFQYKMLGLRGG